MRERKKEKEIGMLCSAKDATDDVTVERYAYFKMPQVTMFKCTTDSLVPFDQLSAWLL